MDSLTGRVTDRPAGTTGTQATVQLWSGGLDLAPRRVPVPEPAAGELLVGVRLATVCGSDRHTVAGRRSSPSPGVLGHEAVGEVLAVGAGGVRDVAGAAVAVGDRIVWSVTVSCGECDRCRAGRTAKCREVRKVGHEPFAGDWPLSGCYATHLHLPAGAHVVRVPDALADVVAAPAGCATATVVAALSAGGPLPGRRVLVHGAGMLGLAATAYAVDRGAAEVTVVDPDPGRLDLAARFGASATRLVDEPQEAAAYDVAVELSGAASSVEQALRALTVGGTLVLAGSVAPGPAVPLDPERVVRGWLTVTGVHNYEPEHLREAVDFLARTPDRPWPDLVADPRPLADLPGLLAEETARAPRLAVRP